MHNSDMLDLSSRYHGATKATTSPFFDYVILQALFVVPDIHSWAWQNIYQPQQNHFETYMLGLDPDTR